jgi:hypothetical protein
MENLLKVMAIPTSRYDGVCRTSDGFYMGRERGDIGYNAFLGSPSLRCEGPGYEFRIKAWERLSEEEKTGVRWIAAHPEDGEPIPLEEFIGESISEGS